MSIARYAWWPLTPNSGHQKPMACKMRAHMHQSNTKTSFHTVLCHSGRATDRTALGVNIILMTRKWTRGQQLSHLNFISTLWVAKDFPPNRDYSLEPGRASVFSSRPEDCEVRKSISIDEAALRRKGNWTTKVPISCNIYNLYFSARFVSSSLLWLALAMVRATQGNCSTSSHLHHSRPLRM